MPGVVTTTRAVAGPTSQSAAPAAQYFVIGLAERGPIDSPQTVYSVQDLLSLFGNPTPYSRLHDDLRLFFEEGGGRARVVRVVGPGATTGKLATPLMDSSDTPKPTVAVEAASPGQWSEQVSVQVLPGAIDDTFRIVVKYGGTRAGGIVIGGTVVEDWQNLRSPMQMQTVNARSQYIRVTNLGSTSVGAEANPAVMDAAVGLSAGSDDRANVSAATVTTALSQFPKGLGDGAVAIPGWGPAVHSALTHHAAENNRIAILAAEQGADIGTLLSVATSIATLTVSGQGPERAGLFAPWVMVPDGFGGRKAVSPEGLAAAKRAQAHERVGPWQAGAGEIGRAKWALAPEQSFTPSEVETLNSGSVNPIAVLSGALRIYGWRSCSSDRDNWQMLTGADTLNRIITLANTALEPYVFGAVDGKGHLLQAIAGVLEGIAKPIADRDGLFAFHDEAGTQLDPGYVIDTQTANTPLDLTSNAINAYLGVRVVPTAELIRLTITKAGVSASL